MIFYCKGVIETVKKLGWSPEIIHCQGWFSALIPLYIKAIYNEDPLFSNTKIIYNVTDTEFKGKLNPKIVDKLLFERKLSNHDLTLLKNPNYINLNKFAIDYSDAVIQGSQNINKNVMNYMKDSQLPLLSYPGKENYEDEYSNFFNSLIEEREGELIEV